MYDTCEVLLLSNKVAELLSVTKVHRRIFATIKIINTYYTCWYLIKDEVNRIFPVRVFHP